MKRGRREEGGGRYIRQPSFICSADVQREWFLDSKLSSLYTITVPGLHVEVCFNLCIQSIGRGGEGKEKREEENWEYKKREERRAITATTQQLYLLCHRSLHGSSS